MLRKLAAVALCAASLVSAYDFAKATTDRPDKAIAAKHFLASSQRYNVTHDDNGFKVNGQRVHDYDVDASLRKPGSIRELFKSNSSKLAVRRVGSDYAIERHDQLKGCGPVFAGWAYWITKSACYGVVGGAIGAGAGAAVALAGPAAPIVAAATSTLGAGTVTTAAGVTCAVTTAGAGAVAAGVAASPLLAEAAVVATTSAVSGGMGLGAFVAFTESVSLAASAFVLALPTP